MQCCLQKDFFKRTSQRKKKGRFHEQPEEKRNELGKKTEFYRMGFSASGNDSDRMDELLSDDSGIHPVFTDRYGHQPEIQRICKLCPYFKRPDL